MRYLVKAKLKPGKENALLQAIQTRALGKSSVAGGEYLRDMFQARHLENGKTRWVEVCFCAEPLQEEIPYWEEYFEILEIKNAHSKEKCKDLNGSEPWACLDCDCTERLEARMKNWGALFITKLHNELTEVPASEKETR